MRGTLAIKFGTITRLVRRKSNPNVSLVDITPETEAFGLLVLENNYEKWPELKKLEDVFAEK